MVRQNSVSKRLLKKVQNSVLPYLPQKWYGNCRAGRTGGGAHDAYVAPSHRYTGVEGITGIHITRTLPQPKP